MTPGPMMSASVVVEFGASVMHGRTFQPLPNRLATCESSGGDSLAPPPFSPVGFSAEIERVFAPESNGRLPRPRPSDMAASKDHLHSRRIHTPYAPTLWGRIRYTGFQGFCWAIRHIQGRVHMRRDSV